ncbi:Z1 domain-containing protein [Rhodanobacter aciditrophus]|uniref:Z1 domain-containing protein n=1 Tax=Rhodanobacter aciditrophus TaxID=1623218 RepID=UPI003CEA03AC
MNETEMERLIEILDGVLQAMTGPGPAALKRRLRFELDERQVTADVDGAVAWLFGEMLGGDASQPGHAVFARHIRSWDAANEAPWSAGTKRLTQERRSLVCSLLNFDAGEQAKILDRIPIAKSFDDATLIATEHQDWYSELRKRRTGTFYWDHYKRYLQNQGGWDENATSSLDESTDKVLRCLSDPERQDAFAVRGLVVGYVQSGKTANFTAVVAKSLDAGYRLIIVLAGVLDSLRFQTQRRLDKELVGREQILQDKEADKPHEYSGDQDWDKFASYGGLPGELGAFNLRRITTSARDYINLGQGRDVLKFEKRYPDRPLNDPDNLHSATARIVVIKKHPAVIRKLMLDLRGLKVTLDDIPTLIIDDESDQASVNTVNPNRKRKAGKPDKDRTSTNESIVQLLAMFPRSQYVGYTATPAANTLINPSDSQDLFPRDFIELLPRPANYMGVSDFHDFDADFNPLDKSEVEELGYHSHRKAFVRQIKDSDDTAVFRKAIDAFFLAGAMKLLRADRDPGSVSTRHHTMLVHRATSQDAHEDDRNLVTTLLAQNAYRRKSALDRLWRLWLDDFSPVSEAQEPGLARPLNLAELEPFLTQAFEKFESARKQVLVVNGRDDHKDDMPDFDKENVWNILVGGAKLSRGYTVEGLTISYFLRKAAAADTLMQMGRWFGFRRGYRDLVRLYIGTQVSAGKKSEKKTDLYDLFESICMDEERFRKRIALYSKDGIRPIQVPPLVPMGMMIPTQKNKMYNAEITMENFGGNVAESTRVPFNEKDRKANAECLRTLVANAALSPVELFGYDGNGAKRSLHGHVRSVDPLCFVHFLQAYRWGTVESQFSSVLGFLNGVGEDSPGIDSWLILVLENPSSKSHWSLGDLALGTFSRAVVNDRFKVFSESRHRDVAKHLSYVEQLGNPNEKLRALARPRQGVCLIYPTVSTDFSGAGKVEDKAVTVGLSLTFPKNGINQKMNWRVRDPSKEAPAFLDDADDDVAQGH